MPKKTFKKNILLVIAGGIGKNVLATAVVESIKKSAPQSSITIATAYPFVWKNNPHVVSALDLNSEMYGFFKDQIAHGNWTILNHDPYHADEYLNRQTHLIDTWCHLIGIEPVTHTPSLFFTETEKDLAKRLLPDTKKPLFFIQTSGGAPNQRFPISWARDLPLEVAQTVVNDMNKKGYHTVHLRRNNQPALENTTWVEATPRDMMAMMPFSKKRLFIDSLPQHAAAAFNLPSVVMWIVNDPKIFGHKMHTNIQADVDKNFRHNPMSYLEKYDITGAIEQDPFNDNSEIFDAEEILKALNKQK